jgi:hypothetical protein
MIDGLTFNGKRKKGRKKGRSLGGGDLLPASWSDSGVIYKFKHDEKVGVIGSMAYSDESGRH